MRNDAERLAIQWGIPLALALLAVGARLMMSTDRLTLIGIMRGIIVGLFVGCMVNLYLSDSAIGDGTRGAIVGAAAVMAEDILIILIKFGQRARQRPDILIDIIFNRGGKK